MLLTCVSPALAVDPAVEPTGPDSPGEADDSVLEVGVWYVNDYENCGGWGLGDLSGVHIDAQGARDRLTSGAAYPSPAWTSRFTYGNYSAWEEDMKKGSAGGTEEAYLDNVDLAYFSGHGHSSGFFFGVYGNKRDDCQLTKSDALYSWGTKDNDWVALSACQVLDDPYESYRYWARAMNGTRLIMGMQTPMSDAPTGDWFGWYVRNNQSFTYAWFKAADVLLGSDEVARVLAERWDYFGDTWNKHNVATAVDDYFSVWTHRAKTQLVAAAAQQPQANLEILNDEMPVFKVQPLSTGEANALWADLGTAFGVSNTTIITEAVAAGLTAPGEAPEIYYTPGAEMVMDTSAGLYQYANADTLWTPAAALQAATADGVHAIGPTEAYTIAAQFLTQNQLMPGDVKFATVTQDVVTEVQDPARFAGAAEAAATPLQVLVETPTNYVVNWERYITYTAPAVGAAGVQAEVEITVPVVGPGSKLDVYVAATVPAGVTGASLLEGSVLGGNGGSRRIQAPVQGAGADEAMTTPMLPPATIKTLFERLGGSVVLGYVPIAAESMEVQTIQSAAYWDGPMRWQQDQLIPVYIVPIQATLPLSLPVPLPLQSGSGAGPAAGHATQTLTQYIPVNSEFMAPYAKILSPAPGAAVLPGAPVVLEAADASKTLAELGVDPTLNFALGTGDPDSYEYNWYRDEVAAANLIGTTRVLNYTPPGVNLEEGKPTQIKIVLEVVDALSQRDPKTAYAEVIFDVNNIFAPFVQK
jgi:hypothetical protein